MTSPAFWSESWTAAAVNHLWQSTVVAAIAWLLALALRKNHGRARYWVWMAASMKFLLPFSLLMTAGEWLQSWIPARAAPPTVVNATEQVMQPFTGTRFFGAASLPSATHPANWLPVLLLAIWLGGVLVVAIRFGRGWWGIWSAKRVARPLELAAEVPVLCSSALMEPGIFGIFRPVLLMPEGILERLSPEQMRAIVAHEMCHVRRRDNLTFAMHMVAEALFWFHPAVWWIGARLVEERERACDEAVLQAGSGAQDYAEGILTVCKFYVESPLECVAGVTGSDLKQRIVRIMAEQVGVKLTLGKKLLLSVAASTAFAFPILFAILLSPGVEAQLLHPTGGAAPSFEVATIKPNHNAGDRFSFRLLQGRFMAEDAPLIRLIRFAYNVKSDRQIRFLNPPDWVKSGRFDIDAKVSDAEVDTINKLAPYQRFEQYQLMLQSLLADRFQMKIRTETQELPVYTLVVVKNGSKLTPSVESPETQKRRFPQLHLTAGGDLQAASISMPFFADWLSGKPDTGDRVVIDATGLQGDYNFTLKWSPTDMSSVLAADSSEPQLFTALQEQLGLKLEPRKAPVEVLVIDHVEKPLPN